MNCALRAAGISTGTLLYAQKRSTVSCSVAQCKQIHLPTHMAYAQFVSREIEREREKQRECVCLLIATEGERWQERQRQRNNLLKQSDKAVALTCYTTKGRCDVLSDVAPEARSQRDKHSQLAGPCNQASTFYCQLKKASRQERKAKAKKE